MWPWISSPISHAIRRSLPEGRAPAAADAVRSEGELRRPGVLAERRFRSTGLRFPPPMAGPTPAPPQSLAAINRQDLVNFHKTWFGPNNAILAIVGDVSADEAFAGAERVWKMGEIRRQCRESARSAAADQAARRDRSTGRRADGIRPGPAGLPEARTIWRSILPSRFSAERAATGCTESLRSERGLTYGASADTNALKDGGDIVAETDLDRSRLVKRFA